MLVGRPARVNANGRGCPRAGVLGQPTEEPYEDEENRLLLLVNRPLHARLPVLGGWGLFVRGACVTLAVPAGRPGHGRASGHTQQSGHELQRLVDALPTHLCCLPRALEPPHFPLAPRATRAWRERARGPASEVAGCQAASLLGPLAVALPAGAGPGEEGSEVLGAPGACGGRASLEPPRRGHTRNRPLDPRLHLGSPPSAQPRD